jgi:hypothetical protein
VTAYILPSGRKHVQVLAGSMRLFFHYHSKASLKVVKFFLHTGPNVLPHGFYCFNKDGLSLLNQLLKLLALSFVALMDMTCNSCLHAPEHVYSEFITLRRYLVLCFHKVSWSLDVNSRLSGGKGKAIPITGLNRP